MLFAFPLAFAPDGCTLLIYWRKHRCVCGGGGEPDCVYTYTHTQQEKERVCVCVCTHTIKLSSSSSSSTTHTPAHTLLLRGVMGSCTQSFLPCVTACHWCRKCSRGCSEGTLTSFCSSRTADKRLPSAISEPFNRFGKTFLAIGHALH